MISDRLKQQLTFLCEVDKMKNVLRQTLLADGSRQETDAEHSWHLALMAMVLYEYAPQGTDLARSVQMALVHDLVEVYAGDTFAYDAQGNLDKAAREKEAADKLFALLPPEQGTLYRSLWEEFDAMETPDARFAASLDRLQPLLNNYQTQGHTWKIGPVTSDKVYKRADIVRTAMPEVWPVIDSILQDSIKKGYLLP